MATTVQSFVGGGTNLTELTSGELLFCSLLKTGYTILSAQIPTGGVLPYVGLGFDNSYVDTNGKGVDMSKISQISFVASKYSGNGMVGWENNSGQHIKASFSANTHFSINAPSGDNSHSMFEIFNSGTGFPIVKVTSFTTTDGKVHTADNLNY